VTMGEVSLTEIALLLGAAAIAAPLARMAKIGTVLGYLIAGVVLGPFGIGQFFSIYQAKEFLHFAEFGIVLLLFLIGLELRPKRLWSMRATIIGFGGAQVIGSGILLGLGVALLGFPWLAAIFLGLAFALSSTAFALQVLDEKGELTARHGRLSFAILLFQDIAVIPLIALTPLFAVTAVAANGGMSTGAVLHAVAVIGGVVVVGHFLLEHILRLVARTKVKEAMTALALLTVVGTAAVMQWAGLSASLGGFIAGALLAESSYRHELEADLKPFEGLLLGLFFTAIGMSLQFDLLFTEPGTILGLVAALIIVKGAVLFALGCAYGLDVWGAKRLGIALSQGGEFAFVLLTAGVAASVVDSLTADLGALVVTLTMIATPILLLIDEQIFPRPGPAEREPDPMPERAQHVIIAGFGRFGQIVARILRARRIPFTALDLDAAQIDLVKRFGNEAFFGDARRLDILHAARLKEASAFVLAVDDVEASVAIARVVRHEAPDVPIFARARDRVHYHRLMELGVSNIRRETYASALDMTRSLLGDLGLSQRDVTFTIETFDRHDHARLIEDYAHYTDADKLREQARSTAETLALIFDEDSRSQSFQSDETSEGENTAGDANKTISASGKTRTSISEAGE
jgi:glutathione-regulated potassium-efflux system protein KefB